MANERAFFPIFFVMADLMELAILMAAPAEMVAKVTDLNQKYLQI